MTGPELDRLARSFDAAADVYERGRPGYPDDAVAWLVGDARRVLDLGAGTGQLTRSLVARGLDVVAVEPLENMRAHLTRAVPGAEVRAGTAEEIPAGDGEFDAVVAGQAWQWFDAKAASAEARGVLRPGGVLAVVWNLRDRLVPWVDHLSRVMLAGDPAATRYRKLDPAPGFGPVEYARFRYDQVLDRAGLADLVASRAWVITRSPAEREARIGAALEVANRHLAGDVFTLPHNTECYRAARE